ncbi:MAG TPA: hypothetical protein VFA43_26615 [Gemmatimonadaceae bacterium]|nr:hypothetical protein [Gemmatimonadaceae bacterium]
MAGYEDLAGGAAEQFSQLVRGGSKRRAKSEGEPSGDQPTTFNAIVEIVGRRLTIELGEEQ